MNQKKLQTLLTGLAFGESPRWHKGRLWFSDWEAHEIVSVDLKGNRETISLPFKSFPFSIDWLPDGRLLIISISEGLLRQGPNGSLVSHADLSSLSVKGWNEIVVDGRGNIYINAINFDLMSGEQFKPGVIILISSDGSVRQVADGVAFPNGMVVTPDNATLIVSESYGNKLTAFDIAADGSLSNRRVWAETGEDHPDGICLDAEGAIWYGDVGNKRCVRIREGGEILDTINLDQGCFACMLGGKDEKTLFMVTKEWQSVKKTSNTTQTSQVVMTEAPAAGAGWPARHA